MSVDLERLKADLAIAGIDDTRVHAYSGELHALVVEIDALELIVFDDGDVSLRADGFLAPLDWTALAIIGRAVDQAVKP